MRWSRGAAQSCGWVVLALVTCISLKLEASTLSPATGATARALRIGESASSHVVAPLVNYPSRSAKIADFRGKVLVLDFWFTGCRPCIASWPELLRLQKEFAGKVQILLVNPLEDEATVLRFMETRRKYAGVDMTLPSVCKGSSLPALFPVPGYPHVVVMDRNGVVRSLASSLDTKDIEAALRP
jgi:thiol-disulfide isomerase/thioredoxin